METNAVAVIGVAGRFPGAPDVDVFWKNLTAGVEAVRFFTEEELRAAGESSEALADPSYVRARPRLEGIDLFDAEFFGMSPRDAALFDPQHRLFLECAWEAFERAGRVPGPHDGPVGVFAACGMNDYMIKNILPNRDVMRSAGEWLVRHMGNDTNFLATRVSYELDLLGPSMNVQTACSSSLVAVHVACQSLLAGECDMALVGGTTIYAEQNRGYFRRDVDILSADGHTRSFDESATGTTFGSAVACALLKRLSDAERDGDPVLAVIRGSAVNNDGRDRVGYFAPSVNGQARAITEALGVAGVSPADVSYVEAHGIGTRLGDPIEVAALTQAFRAFTTKKQYCGLGSLKSSIGHAGEASGIAAFVKAVLALHHGKMPPTLHFQSPNPRCELDSSPFFVNASLRPWEGSVRIAGVTSLGVGGTNCHVILQSADARVASPPCAGSHVLVLSAKTPAALDAATQNLAQYLTHSAQPLGDVAFTLAAGRKELRYRRAIVAADAQEAVQAIASMDPSRVFSGEQKGDAGASCDPGVRRNLSTLIGAAQSWTRGETRIAGAYEAREHRRVSLPTYPWQRKRYWITPQDVATTSPTARDRAFIAARTAVERDLAAVWCELLGVDRVGIRDDFFDLGGQSVVAVRLVSHIHKNYGVDLPLATLLEAPTIERCAALITERTPKQPQKARSLVTIEAGDGSTPFYCVHGAGGNVLNFRDLSRALGAGQPFYALQARGIDGVLPPHESIEEMAEAYIGEVRAFQPHGPYMIGGYSGGGLVAFEMAQRLTDLGEPVSLLVLIDTFHPAVPVREMTMSRRLERMRGEGVANYLGRVIERKVAGQRARRNLEEVERFLARGEPIPAELRDRHLTQSFERARSGYRPKPWKGRAVLFRVEKVAYIYSDVSPAYGWEDVISDLTVKCVPGNHDNLLLAPHVPVLIEGLRAAMTSVRSRPLERGADDVTLKRPSHVEHGPGA